MGSRWWVWVLVRRVKRTRWVVGGWEGYVGHADCLERVLSKPAVLEGFEGGVVLGP